MNKTPHNHGQAPSQNHEPSGDMGAALSPLVSLTSNTEGAQYPTEHSSYSVDETISGANELPLSPDGDSKFTYPMPPVPNLEMVSAANELRADSEAATYSDSDGTSF